MDKILGQFYRNEVIRDAVWKFLESHLKEEAVSRVFEGKDTKGITDAKVVLDSAFIRLRALYGEIERPKNKSNR